MPNPYRITKKILVLGAAQIGKSCFIQSATHDDSVDQSFTDPQEREIIISDIELIFSECSSQFFEKDTSDIYFNSHFYCRPEEQCNACVIIYDATNSASFDTAVTWIEKIKNTKKKPLIFLVNNIKNADESQEVNEKLLNETCRKYNETCEKPTYCTAGYNINAKTGANVHALLEQITSEIIATEKIPYVLEKLNQVTEEGLTKFKARTGGELPKTILKIRQVLTQDGLTPKAKLEQIISLANSAYSIPSVQFFSKNFRGRSDLTNSFYKFITELEGLLYLPSAKFLENFTTKLSPYLPNLPLQSTGLYHTLQTKEESEESLFSKLTVRPTCAS